MHRQDNVSFAQASPMPLHYLEFDHCEDSDGLHSWDAVASPAPHHNRTLLTEVRGVLAQCDTSTPFCISITRLTALP